MTPRIERLANGWLVRQRRRAGGTVRETLDKACDDIAATAAEPYMWKSDADHWLERQSRAARLLRYLHRYDDWCEEVPTTEGFWWLRHKLDHSCVFPARTIKGYARRERRKHYGLLVRGLGNDAWIDTFGDFEWMRAHVPMPTKVAGPMMTKEGE